MVDWFGVQQPSQHGHVGLVLVAQLDVRPTGDQEVARSTPTW